MTIQTRVDDGISIKTRTYRNIYKNTNLAQMREAFLMQRSFCRWGEMVQMKGTERIVLQKFGTCES